MTVDEIDRFLAESGWHAEREVSADITTWRMAFQLRSEPRLVTVMFPTKRGSVMATCRLRSSRLNGLTLDQVSAQALRTLIRAQSEATGAIVVDWGGGTFVVCAAHRGPVLTSELLKLLILEVADLAERADENLDAGE